MEQNVRYRLNMMRKENCYLIRSFKIVVLRKMK